MSIGYELAFHPDFSRLEKTYIRLFGAPIVGLRIRARNVFSLIPKERPYDRILDAGCGTGVFAFALAKRFPTAHVVGIDISEDAIAAAKQISESAGIRNVGFQMQDLIELDSSSLYDLVICVDILEHIEDDTGAIEGLHRALGPGGILVLHVPALYRRYPIMKKTLNFDVQTHVRVGYELEDVGIKVERTGLSILETGYTYGFFETLANNISYMITRARMENKHLYAFAFPFLNMLARLGARARPKNLGAGIYVVAQKGCT